MIEFQVFFLKALRKICLWFRRSEIDSRPKCIEDADAASQIIYDTLNSEHPCMIGRFGSVELSCLLNFWGVQHDRNKVYEFIIGKSQPWWWESKIIQLMYTNAGFFPPEEEAIVKFGELMLNDIPEIDVLGSWLKHERVFEKKIENSVKIDLELLNPYFSTLPWTRALEGKKVLVVHPFTKTIVEQYKKRNLIFSNDLLPSFELLTLKSVQSISGNETQFRDWFEALDFMKSEIDKFDYDICLIGAGAYGLPLAAHVKRRGKKAFHLGGALQLLFGIKGSRWENPNYSSKFNYSNLMNSFWVKPTLDETPQNADAVENACYW